MLASNFQDGLSEIVGCTPPDTTWAVACGTALALQGLDYVPSDLDLFAGDRAALAINRALATLPIVFPARWHTSPMFSSYWSRYRLDGLEVAVVGDFAVRRAGP